MTELHFEDLDLQGIPTTVTAWHAKPGQAVVEGDRLMEVTAGDVTVDLAAPASGILTEQCVKIDELLTVGQLLARIQPA